MHRNPARFIYGCEWATALNGLWLSISRKQHAAAPMLGKPAEIGFVRFREFGRHEMSRHEPESRIIRISGLPTVQLISRNDLEARNIPGRRHFR